MKCPKCDSEIGNSMQCTKCGINVEIYKKSKAISLKLYNKALVMANSQDISSAIENLNKSIEFDKTNYISRNLLGLLYFEVGEIGNALKQWIISNSYFKDNNNAKQYMDQVQNDARKIEKYNDAIKMYNKALNYMKQKSEDMAIIQLKKALEINPKFIEAYNLLALCYLYLKDNTKALTCIEKVLELDAANKKALTYYNEIKKGAPRPIKVEKNVNTKTTTKPYVQVEKKLRRKSAFSDIASFLLGAITIGVVMYVLMIPSVVKDKDSKIAQLTQTNESFNKQLNTKTDENKQLTEQFAKEKTQLEQDNMRLQAQVAETEQQQKVQQIQDLYNNNNKDAAAQLLLSLDGTTFKPETKATYETLKAKIIPELAKKYYNQGMDKYAMREYSEAKVLLEKSLSMSTTEVNSSDALYFSGRIDEINGDIASAKMIYQKLINNYPNANQLKNAKARLEALG